MTLALAARPSARLSFCDVPSGTRKPALGSRRVSVVAAATAPPRLALLWSSAAANCPHFGDSAPITAAPPLTDTLTKAWRRGSELRAAKPVFLRPGGTIDERKRTSCVCSTPTACGPSFECFTRALVTALTHRGQHELAAYAAWLHSQISFVAWDAAATKAAMMKEVAPGDASYERLSLAESGRRLASKSLRAHEGQLVGWLSHRLNPVDPSEPRFAFERAGLHQALLQRLASAGVCGPDGSRPRAPAAQPTGAIPLFNDQAAMELLIDKGWFGQLQSTFWNELTFQPHPYGSLTAFQLERALRSPSMLSACFLADPVAFAYGSLAEASGLLPRGSLEQLTAEAARAGVAGVIAGFVDSQHATPQGSLMAQFAAAAVRGATAVASSAVVGTLALASEVEPLTAGHGSGSGSGGWGSLTAVGAGDEGAEAASKLAVVAALPVGAALTATAQPESGSKGRRPWWARLAGAVGSRLKPGRRS